MIFSRKKSSSSLIFSYIETVSNEWILRFYLDILDADLFGLCPAWDEFYLVHCDECHKVLKPMALKHHIGKRLQRWLLWIFLKYTYSIAWRELITSICNNEYSIVENSIIVSVICNIENCSEEIRHSRSSRSPSTTSSEMSIEASNSKTFFKYNSSSNSSTASSVGSGRNKCSSSVKVCQAVYSSIPILLK